MVVIAIPISSKFAIEKPYNICGIAPAGVSPKGDKSPIKITLETPAAINKETPEPTPHFVITSSKNKIINPPKAIWKPTIGIMAGVLAGTALNMTNAKPSTKHKNIVSTFWVPWNFALPSIEFKSQLSIFEPTKT